MPVWNEKTKQWVKQGRLVVLGVAQEQHPDRCRLFAQWRQLDWPILHDPINAMQVTGVPIEVAIDEYGIVRSMRPKPETLEQDFLNRTFAPLNADTSRSPGRPQKPDISALRLAAEQTQTAEAWRNLADSLVLWQDPNRIDDAIEAYKEAIRIEPGDGDAHFRLGVCYRTRYESDQRTPTDFQTAVDHWGKAREISPNQYIWRRRIEQYGPRLNKPYPFYDWVDDAARDILSRGEQPVKLRLAPTGSELSRPPGDADSPESASEPPDPQGRIARDTDSLILAEVAVVPSSVKPGGTVRVYVTLRPNVERKAHWNNLSEASVLWIDRPSGWKVQPQLLKMLKGDQPETSEPRALEFEVRAQDDAAGKYTLAAYALYSVCEGEGGTCRFMRKDIPITVTVSR